jgi:hypothetical protein
MVVEMSTVDVAWLVEVVDDESLHLVRNVEEINTADIPQDRPELLRRIDFGDHLGMFQDNLTADRRHVASTVIHRSHQEISSPSVTSQGAGLSP